MTEKEFLETFIEWLEDNSKLSYHSARALAPVFLEQHHKEYYEVAFIKIEDEDLLAEQNSEYDAMISRSLRR